MPAYVYVVLAAGWLAWMLPFFLLKRNRDAPAKLDRRARWGIMLEGLAYSMLWWTNFWERSPEPWRVALSVALFLLGALLSWTSARTLGRQWRIDAGLNPDHELVRSGAYRVVRHPIYASMLCLLLATGFLVTPLPLLAIALVIFVIGTEIRVRIEDALLAARFGDQFRDFKHRVFAYIPFVR
jgi:protein-S-isoprenylcysteine O-methyltransferase Ste14